MRKFPATFFYATALLILTACASHTSAPTVQKDPLAGTNWQLEKIEYMDDTSLTPVDSRQYTIAFDTSGTVSVQADCNRLHGSYTFLAPSGIEFGALLSTRAACPPGSLYDTMVKDLPFVRSFVIKDGKLYLALMADGGIYQFSPIATQ